MSGFGVKMSDELFTFVLAVDTTELEWEHSDIDSEGSRSVTITTLASMPGESICASSSASFHDLSSGDSFTISCGFHAIT